MSDQPPYPSQPPPQGPWTQQPGLPPQPPFQPSYQPPGQPFYSPTPEGPPRRTPWGLVIGALVAGLLVGGGAAAGVMALANGDPTDSDEYQALSEDLDDAESSLAALEEADPTASDPTASATTPTAPTSPTSPAAPTDPTTPDPGSGGTQDIDGWTVTEPVISKDALDDFAATLEATNNTGEPAIAYFTVTLKKGSTTVSELTCLGDDGDDIAVGATTTMECLTVDDYVEGGWDDVVVEYQF